MTPEPSTSAGSSESVPAGKRKWLVVLRRVVVGLGLLCALLAVDGRMAAMIRFTNQAHVPGLNDDFKLLPELLPRGGAVLTELAAGLPHPYAEPKDFVLDLWLKRNRSIKGYRFYRQTAGPTEPVRAVMVDLLSQQGSFSPYIGPKLCGGYHADFAAKLEFGGKHVWMLVCLGCKEVLIYSDGKELICEVRREVAEKLADAWRDHLGIPYALVSTRLPLPLSFLADLDFRGTEAGKVTEEHIYSFYDRQSAPSAALGKVYFRTQSFYRNSDKSDDGRGAATINIQEETYASPAQAKERAKEIETRKGTPPKQYDRTFEDGFALENRVYWMSGFTRGRREGMPELLLVMKERLRRHCEETTTHEVRFYD